MKLTDKQYEDILNKLDNIYEEDEKNVVYDMEDYVDSFKDVVDKEIAKRNIEGQPLEHDNIAEMFISVFEDFINRLDPKTADNKYSKLVTQYQNKDGVIEKANKDTQFLPSHDINDRVTKMMDKDYIIDVTAKHFKEILKSGQELTKKEKDKFIDLPIHKVAYETGDIFKSIFNVEKTDEELEKIKKTNEEQYKQDSKGKNKLDKDNIKNALGSYKMLTDKAKKTSVFQMLIHLPSFIKLKSNTKKLKQQMINKGINEKLIDDVASGKENLTNAFERNNQLNNPEAIIEPLNQEKEILVEDIKQEEKTTKKTLTNEDIDKMAKKITDNNKVLQSKGHSTAKVVNKDKAIKHWKEYKKIQAKINEYTATLERGDKFFEDANKKINEYKNQRIPLKQEYDNIYKTLTKNDLDYAEITKLSNINLEESKNQYNDKQIKLINTCKQYFNCRSQIIEIETELEKWENTIKNGSKASDKYRSTQFFLQKEEIKLKAEKKAVAKYAGCKIEQVESVGKIYDKELDSALLFKREDLQKKFEIVNEDEEEMEDDVSINEDLHNKLDDSFVEEKDTIENNQQKEDEKEIEKEMDL